MIEWSPQIVADGQTYDEKLYVFKEDDYESTWESLDIYVEIFNKFSEIDQDSLSSIEKEKSSFNLFSCCKSTVEKEKSEKPQTKIT